MMTIFYVAMLLMMGSWMSSGAGEKPFKSRLGWGITVERLKDGGCILHFSSLRNLANAIFLSFCAAFLTFGFVGLRSQGNTGLGGLIFVAVWDSAMYIVALYVWLSSDTITVHPD